MIILVLLILALICFVLAAFGVAVSPRVNLVALGLVFVTIAWIIPLV